MSDATRRVFFALWPDVRQRDRLRDVVNSVAKTVEGKAVDRRNWHVTLSFIGEVQAERVPELLERMSAVPVQPFRLTFNRLEFWPRPKLAVLHAQTVPAELQALVESLNAVTMDLGVLPQQRNYRPHITVVKNARPFETQPLSQRMSFEWDSFELLESVRAPGGVSYRALQENST